VWSLLSSWCVSAFLELTSLELRRCQCDESIVLCVDATSARYICHFCYSYLLLPFLLLSRHDLFKCVRIQFLPPFSPTILYSMFVLFMRTQRKSPWKLFVTEIADIARLISVGMCLVTNTTKPKANIIQSTKNAFLMPLHFLIQNFINQLGVKRSPL
jgi:hypothetical protein